MNKQKFDGFAKKYDSWFVSNEKIFLSELALVKEAIHSVNKKNILSIGCGSGLFEKALEKEGIFVKNGIEPSVDMAEIARKRGMNVQVATIEDAHIDKDTYDLIYFNGSSSYISDLDSAYKKCFSALKENGYLILFDVPKDSAYGLMYNLAKNVGSYDHEDLDGVMPALPYPIDLVKSANWQTTERKIEALKKIEGIKSMRFMQTLCNNPYYTDKIVEEVREGYKQGGYVAIIVEK